MCLLRRFFISAGLVLMVCTVSSQTKKYDHQFHVTSENDSYVSINLDGYYTNGLVLSYQWRKSGDDSGSKININTIEIGQNIYNSQDGHDLYKKIDRPITGYLYGAYRRAMFNEKDNMLRWGVELGAIGPPALGKEVQQTIHRWWQIYKPDQWQYQMHSGMGVTGNITWSPRWRQFGEKNKFELKPVAGASLGNMFTNAMVGAALLYGRFNSNSQSAFWNNHSGHSKKDRELFFYIYPSLYLQAYNATVQGNIFSDKTEPVAGKLNPLFFLGRAGFMYARNKYALGYSFQYENKQSLTQRSGDIYGSIQISFIW